MENIFNRLQFVKHEEVFATREEAVNYVLQIQPIERPALLAEPMVLLYESEDAAKGPNVILAIGSVGDGKTLSNANKTFFIDTQKTEEEIEALDEKIEEAIKSLTLVPITSDTIAMSAEKTAEGTFVSGDVKIADYRIIDGVVVDNIIETEGEKGIYTFVDMEYDPETFVITFKTTKATKEFQLPTDQHVVKGEYSIADEAIILTLADDSTVNIDVKNLIDEWTVLPDSETPVLLYKEHVSSATDSHDGIFDWQDVLTADVRVADHISDNIIHKDRTGRYLYVKGTADNIKYAEGVTVKEAIDNIDTRVSTSEGNLIYKRADGIYAYAMLDYKQAENKLVYKYTDGNTADVKTVEFQLNSVKVLEDITYDPVKEVIVIRYIDAKGEYQRVEIPAKDIIEEWVVDNEGHNIYLDKFRSEGQGKDILTADVKIHNGDNNILEDKDHTLYVNGIASNIKYDVTGNDTVKNVLDTLKVEKERIEEKLDDEIARSTAEDEKIETTIGTGFSTDSHETITYKFEQLSDKVNSEADKLQNEIDRSEAKDEEHDNAISGEVAARTADVERIDGTIGDGFSKDAHETITYKFDELTAKVNSEADKLQAEIDRSTSADTVHDGRLDTIETEIGDGFGPRNTVRDEIENLQSEIDAVSADSSSRLSDIINEDKSINVDRTNPTEPVLKVNISGHENNTIRLIQQEGAEGLFNFVDLSYDSDENQLIFTRSTSGTTDFSKTIQLKSVTFIEEVYYDKDTEELVIIYYNGEHHREELRIPLKALIDEWDVYNDVHSAVKLTKVWDEAIGKNILSAEVIISDKEDNILENQEGELYVSNSAITANAAAITAEKTRAQEAETLLDDKLDAEISRATAKESELQTAITAEAARAADAEEVINNKLIVIDNTIGDGFSTDSHETITYKFDELQTQVNSEADKLQAEIDRSTSADTEHNAGIEALSNKIGSGFTTDPHDNVTYKFERLVEIVDSEADELDAETARAKAAELALNSKIDQEISDRIADVDAEETRASDEETRIENKLDQEISRATAAEGVLTNKIGTGFTDSADDNVTFKFKGLQTQVNSEAAELDAEIARATAKDTELTNALQQEISDRITDVDAEEARAISAETSLQTAIHNEEIRAISAETDIETALSKEITSARTEEARIEAKLNDEIANRIQDVVDEENRATNEENILRTSIRAEHDRAVARETELNDKILSVSGSSIAADAQLQISINEEASARTLADNALEDKIDDEITRSTNKDTELTNALQQEISDRQQGDAELADAIREATLTFDDTTSIDFTKTTGNVVTADVKLQEGDNIIKLGQGLYATATLEYEPTGNKLRLVTSNGAQEYIQLVGATLLDSIEYDPVNKMLIIKYTDGTGSQRETSVGVSELFNEWDVAPLSENGAIELTKTPAAEPGGADKLSARVIISDHEDNALRIDGNALYVPASDMEDAKEIALCAKNELSVLERAVIGHKIYEECGSGYTYEPNVDATYISGATNFYNADFKLDQNLKRVEKKVDDVSGDTVCVDSKANKIYELLYGTGSTIQGCGEGIKYSPDLGSCVISAATSFMEADRMLGDQMCEILEMWQSGETCTTKSDWIDDGANKKMIVDVKVSRGNDGTMTDDEIIIENLNGDYIDPTRTEFTDTNALRIVCLQEGAGGVIPAVNSPQNGVYLSNVWDCGLYYDEVVDADAITAANAAGYKTDSYRTDTDSTASNYDYNNNVRQ